MPRALLLSISLVAVLVTGSRSQIIPQSNGAVAAWQAMLKLRTTASVMHVTAHPDDEHGGVLTKVSRGDGARVALLTLNRGESGDNAIGPQLFDALGLIRTEELLQSNRYYGVDEQYFTSVVDYGYSKTLEESLRQWGRETVLRDVVRIVRTSRPTIILSRFQGNERDGHGNHSAAGVMAVEAFRAAADPARFPDQIAEGLRPWQAAKVYIGGVRENEDWTVRINSGEFDPVLGDQYDNVARYALSFQRSQNSGRFTPTTGANYGYYRLIGATGATGTTVGKETTIFDGVPMTIEAAIGVAGKAIDQAVAAAMAAYTVTDPSQSAPALADGLRLTRAAINQSKDPDQVFLLKIKERQFQDAINAAVGAQLLAVTNPPVMPAPVPGQTFNADVRLAIRGRTPVVPSAVTLVARDGWQSQPTSPNTFRVTVTDAAIASTRPYFSRRGLQESRYTLNGNDYFGLPVSPAPLTATASYRINGELIEIRETLKRREAKLPYGEVTREVRGVPRLAVTLTPAHAIVSTRDAARRISIDVSLLHNAEAATQGAVTLRLPAGWKSEPASLPFAFTRAGERSSYQFSVASTPDSRLPIPGSFTIEAVASAAGREYREGYELVDHRDLEVRYLYRPATTEVHGVDVATVPGLKVGYVMGIGDHVPMGLQQLGAQVTLLGERDLATGDLSVYDAIITGTRAYAVRDDLKTYNSRLLDYVRAGGNMIVLYNTQELVPSTFAPFPGELPRSAEEVSEEDSPVTVLAPAHQSFNWPNKITSADFNGWVEQRGSKFFTKWDAAYTPMISTFDHGQAPQSGGWLTAKVGKGHWTYFAYALHRQLPYGVAGAYRITANLLALSKAP
jgi:LmbE family N-acetylglucosaminyl deacetylase